MLSNHLIPCCPLLLPSILPSIGAFPMSQLFISDGQTTEASASATVLPMNIQGWFPLGLTGLISLLSKTLKSLPVPQFLNFWASRGMGWGGRWVGGSGWGTHVNPWLIHVDVWQKPLQYYKVISLQLIKINEKQTNKSISSLVLSLFYGPTLISILDYWKKT